MFSSFFNLSGEKVASAENLKPMMQLIELNATFLRNITLFVAELPENEAETLRTITFITCIVVITLGTIGNGLVVFVFGLNWSNLKTFEIFMISLALADFLNAVVAPTQNILELVNFNFRHIGLNGCKIISFISITSLTVTALTLVAVSVDRFIAVKWPFRKRPFQERTLFLVILSTWLTAAVFGSIYFIGGNVCLLSSNNNSVYECYICMNKNERAIFVFSVFSVQTGAPVIVITVLYSLIVIELKNNTKNKIFENSKQEIKIRLLQNRKATKLVVTVVVVFSICFLPINLFYLWYMFHGHQLSIQKIKIIFDILTMLQMCNSIANPIIYSRLHTSFKREIIRLVCPRCYSRSKETLTVQCYSSIASNEKKKKRESKRMKINIGLKISKFKTSVNSYA